VSVALVIQHTTRMRHVIIRSLSGSTVFFSHYFLKVTIVWKTLLSIKRVFLFSPQVLSEIFLVLRTERDMLNKYISLHVNYPLFLSDFKEIRFISMYFRKIFKYQIS